MSGDKTGALHQLKIIKGHIDKVISMVSANAYCIDVLTQSQAIQSSLKRVDSLILEKHLKHCVTDAIAGGNKDTAIAEVVKVFKNKL